MEVCLAAMAIPVAVVASPVDFDSLPTVKLPSSSLAAVEASPENSAGEGTGLQGASDDEPLEEDPQEELGDSTLEAQARGALQLPYNGMQMDEYLFAIDCWHTASSCSTVTSCCHVS